VRKPANLANEVRSDVEGSKRQGKPVLFEGDKADKETPKGRASSVKQAVQKVLLASRSPDKMPVPTGKPAEVSSLSSTLLKKLSSEVNAEYDVSEQTAPYLHSLINKVTNGELTSVDDMVAELKNITNLAAVNPQLYEKVQNTLVQTAKEISNTDTQELERQFGVERNQPEDVQARMGRGSFESMWGEHYSSYFDNEDKPFVESLYSPQKFVDFTDELRSRFAKNLNADRNSEAVSIAVSKDIERRPVELFGKLYTRLDHEKPSEFFHEIEQQDIMRGILPVKNELKRRMTLLSTELERAEHEGKIHNPNLYRRIEVKADIVDVPYGTGEKERIKPRYRLNPYTQPHKSEAGEFVHYLDQIVDHYVEARKYTHNARAIFLHPVDHEKGFYSQLAQFANDMSTVDFDQMMALPDNEVFRDAFSLYDKIVEETFASNDWRHFPTMFELKQNSLHTQVEEDVLEKLKLMYKGQDISDARLEAALSMAVGASRGMFLNEIEKAGFADPHLTEDGKATFASYYNQDASALTTFNPMHQHFRWQAPGTMDPILFMPVEGFRGAQAFTDHRTLYKNMQDYRDSWLQGRGGKDKLGGKVLWSDFLVNVGKVGGPLQRKGWRTGYMLEPLYVRDETQPNKFAYDYVKTWQSLENIGYEVAQDFVAKLAGNPILSSYEGKHGVDKNALKQKNELFSYIYAKYFSDTGVSLESYLKGIRSKAKESVMESIRTGKSAPRDIREATEIEASNTFLHRALARLVSDRIPSKILRIDRDRMTEKGISRWRKIAQDMKLSTKDFDDLMKDLLTAEQLLRKEVSHGMREMLAEGKKPWEHGQIEYRLTPEKVADLLGGKLDGARIAQVQALLRNIQTTYSRNTEYLDGSLAGFLRHGEYKFTFAADEVDLSFIPWRGAGARVLPRAIGDISVIEKSVAPELIKVPKVLQQLAIDGKQDFSPIIEIMTKVHGALDGIHGPDAAHRAVHHIAAMTINYFKKDTRARIAYGLFGLGRKNSLAAERAGGSLRVWEWDSGDIDRFIYAIETRALLPKDPYNPVNSKIEYQPVYMNLPFIKNPVKLPESLKVFGKELRLFQTRKPDYEWYSRRLRMRFGGTMKDFVFDWVNRYIPLVAVWLLWKFIKDALDESEGKKKK